MSTEKPDPQWVREAFGAIAHEIVGWLRALAAVAVAPRRFVADWADGKTRPLNPLAYLLNGLTLSGPISALVVHLVHFPDDGFPFWVQAIKPLFSLAYQLVFLLPIHAGLRLMGGKRRLATTIGASFYGGGPTHILRIVILPIQLLQMQNPKNVHLALLSGVSAMVMMVCVTSYMTAAMAGAHKLPLWRAALVIVFMFLLSFVGWGWWGYHTRGAGMRVVRVFIT